MKSATFFKEVYRFMINNSNFSSSVFLAIILSFCLIIGEFFGGFYFFALLSGLFCSAAFLGRPLPGTLRMASRAVASYNASYNWNLGAMTQTGDNLGNVISNVTNWQVDGQLRFEALYNKSKYLKEVNQKYSGRSGARNRFNPKTIEKSAVISESGSVDVKHGTGHSHRRIICRLRRRTPRYVSTRRRTTLPVRTTAPGRGLWDRNRACPHRSCSTFYRCNSRSFRRWASPVSSRRKSCPGPSRRRC